MSSVSSLPSSPFHPLDAILHKRDGEELTSEEVHGFVRAVVRSGEAKLSGTDLSSLPWSERVTDAQIASFLMAVFQRGFNARELADFTMAMRFSGETFSADGLDAFTIDKHSTGGVGDKTSLLIAPVLAAAGVARPNHSGAPSMAVPMISGRSLGHTGGTLDKLETIPGFNTQLSLLRMREVLQQCGAALVGQTPHLVPADRILYALRDHTGTVESPALITASIMSKKLAEDLRGLVLDVKVGSGALMPTPEASRHLAELLVTTGEAAGTRTVALLSRMDEPLGRFSGNWVEVWECVDILKGKRHAMSADLIELSNTLSGWMLHLAGAADSPEAGAPLADELLRNGEAYRAWLRIVAAQGGDVSVFDAPAAFHRPTATRVLRAVEDGYLATMDCKEIGWAVQRLGAGRARPGDPVGAHAGIESHAKLGQAVAKGEPLFTLFTEQEELLGESLEKMQRAISIDKEAPRRKPLVEEIIQRAR